MNSSEAGGVGCGAGPGASFIGAESAANEQDAEPAAFCTDLAAIGIGIVEWELQCPPHK